MLDDCGVLCICLEQQNVSHQGLGVCQQGCVYIYSRVFVFIFVFALFFLRLRFGKVYMRALRTFTEKKKLVQFQFCPQLSDELYSGTATKASREKEA